MISTASCTEMHSNWGHREGLKCHWFIVHTGVLRLWYDKKAKWRQAVWRWGSSHSRRQGSKHAQLLHTRQLGELWIRVRTVMKARGIRVQRVLRTCFPPAVVWQPDRVVFLALWSDEVVIFFGQIVLLKHGLMWYLGWEGERYWPDFMSNRGDRERQ